MGFNDQMCLPAEFQHVGCKQFIFITLAITDNQNTITRARQGTKQESKFINGAFAPDLKASGHGVFPGSIATGFLPAVGKFECNHFPRYFSIEKAHGIPSFSRADVNHKIKDGEVLDNGGQLLLIGAKKFGRQHTSHGMNPIAHSFKRSRPDFHANLSGKQQLDASVANREHPPEND
jgi:hypothetical protein